MALAPGTRLGAFEITGLLGTGGMGEVYRARDSKLKREVALKVLPPDVAGDPERLARFQREAEVLASLNHPHIAHLYGIEDADGQRALVMELVEGATLDERIARGAIPIDEARAIALQIVDALAAAHEQGIVHRDLKPANVKITPDGAAKVLDFGLARAFDPNTSSTSAVASPTITSPARLRQGYGEAGTQLGTILGTAAYMAPEQARGAVVDKRADIWAFGVLLFEMLTGRRLFDEGTISDTLANVLKTEPEWKRLPVETPAPVRRLLQRCLEKDRKRRLQDIGDARLELESADLPTVDQRVATMPARQFGIIKSVALVAAGVALTLAGLYAWTQSRDSAPASAPSFTFLITMADGVVLDDPPNFSMAPDGQTIALRGSEGGIPYIYLRTLVTGGVRRLNNTRGTGQGIFWSRDSQWLGFTRGGSLQRVAIDDTRPTQVQLGERSWMIQGGQWSANREIAFIAGGAVAVVSDTGGTARVALAPTKELPSFASLSWLPDGRRLLVQSAGTVGGEIYAITADGSEPPRLIEAGAQPLYVAPGWLLAVRGGQLLAWKFDQSRAVVTGPPATIRDNVNARGGIGGRLFAASDTGVVAIRNDFQAASTHLAWFERSGSEGMTLKLDRHCRNPELSPVGDRLAMECYEPGSNNRDIWLYDLARDVASRFTFNSADDADPLWSPDGRTIAFASSRNGPPDVFRKSTGGASPEELMLETPGSTPTGAWSPDGREIALNVAGTISTFAVGGDGKLVPFAPGPYVQLELQYSPDGRFVSYSSDESGRSEIYVQPWPPNGEKWQISRGGATDARWRPDGKELFFISSVRELMAATVETGKGFRAGTPTRLFQTKISGPLGSGHRFPYAVSRDGKRFLMYVSDAQSPPPSITVIVNWPAVITK